MLLIQMTFREIIYQLMIFWALMAKMKEKNKWKNRVIVACSLTMRIILEVEIRNLAIYFQTFIVMDQYFQQAYQVGPDTFTR